MIPFAYWRALLICIAYFRVLRVCTAYCFTYCRVLRILLVSAVVTVGGCEEAKVAPDAFESANAAVDRSWGVWRWLLSRSQSRATVELVMRRIFAHKKVSVLSIIL